MNGGIKTESMVASKIQSFILSAYSLFSRCVPDVDRNTEIRGLTLIIFDFIGSPNGRASGLAGRIGYHCSIFQFASTASRRPVRS